jgi:putative ABC transport system permease protein
MFKNYLKIALRNLTRNKVFSFINIAGLSVGLASCMLILLFSKDERSYDRFHKNAANIYRITVDETMPEGEVIKYGITGMMPGPSFKRELPEISNFTRIQGEFFNIKQGTDVFAQEAHKVDSSFFAIFPDFEFVEGSAQMALKDPQSIVISEEVAAKYFGKKSALGKTLSIDYDGSFQPFIVSGVTKKSPQNSSINIQLLLPFHRDKRPDNQWLNFYINTFVTLNPKANPTVLEGKFAQIYAREAKEQLAQDKKESGVQSKFDYGLQPLLAMHQSTDYPAANGLKDSSNPMYSYILTGLAIFMLLIACINFVNLTVAHSLKRSKEIGIRKVVGSDRQQLIWQFLGESFVLSFFAFVLAIGLVELVLPFFNEVTNKSLALSYLLDYKLVVAYVSLFAVTGLLAGFYPALVLSGFRPVETLYGRFKLAKGGLLQKSLVVFQFTLSALLIVATITIYSQFDFLTKQDLGYNDKNVITLETGRINHTQAATFKNELMQNPTIKQVAANSNGEWYTVAKVNGKQDIEFRVDVVNQDFLSTFQIPVAKGRNFSSQYPADSSLSVLVNEAFVKEAGWKSPIGQTVYFHRHKHKYQVVGVVKNYHYNSLYEVIKPQLFTTDPQMNSFGMVAIRINPTNIPKTLKHIAAKFKQFFPTKPYSYQFKEEANEKQYQDEARWKQIMGFAALLTIFISCIGLFGLAMLSAEKRTKEIGIRKVFGASVSSIVTMLTTDFLKLVMLSMLIAFPIAWWAANKFLEKYPYRISVEVWMFGLAVGVLVLVTLLTVGYQSLKTAMTNPVKSLRTE